MSECTITNTGKDFDKTLSIAANYKGYNLDFSGIQVSNNSIWEDETWWSNANRTKEQVRQLVECCPELRLNGSFINNDELIVLPVEIHIWSYSDKRQIIYGVYEISSNSILTKLYNISAAYNETGDKTLHIYYNSDNGGGLVF